MIVAWAPVVLGGAAHAGAWTKELGELYAKVGADVYGSLRYVSPGTAAEGGSYFGQQVGVYGEVGVLPEHRGQLVVSAPFVIGTHMGTVNDPTGPVSVRASTARFGDLRAGAQIALHERLPLSAAIEVKVPMYANDSVGAAYPTLEALFPLPGDGQIDATAWVFGGATPWKDTFLEAGVGYRHRTELFLGWDDVPDDIVFVDGIPWVAKGGYTMGNVLLLLGTDGIVSVGDRAHDEYTREYVGLFASALIDIAEGIALEPRVAGEVWADHTSQGIGGGLGLSMRR
jgi:hypothetical protein